MRRRKISWLKIILSLVLWVAFFWLIIVTSPDYFSKFTIYPPALLRNALRAGNFQFSIPLTKIAFFILLTLVLSLTLSFIIPSAKKPIILSLFLVVFLLLKMLQAVNWLSLLLLIILTIVMFLA